METHAHDPGVCDSPFTCACLCPFCVNAAHQIMLTSTPARYDFYSPKGQAILNRPMTEEEFEQAGGYFTGDED